MSIPFRGTVERFRSLFTWPQAIRFQLALLFFVYNVHEQLKSSYETKLAAVKIGRESRHYRNTNSQLVSLEERDLVRKPPEEEDEQQRHLAKFPDVLQLFKLYRLFSNGLLVYNLLKYLAPDLLPSVVRLIFGDEKLELPAHCYVAGRFVAPVRLYRTIAILHAVANLSWRFGIKFANRPYKLHLIDFLIQRDCDIREYVARTRDIEHANRFGHQHEDVFDSFMAYESTQTTCLPINGAKRTVKVLRLRPTRTPEAKLHLETRLTWCTVLLALTLGLISLGSIYFIVYHIALDSRHLSVYPNCDLDLLQMIKSQNQTPSQWAQLNHMTPTRDHIVMGLCDYLESVVIWFDSGLGITLVFGLPYILIYDLKMYWRHWNSKLSDILQEVRLRRFVMRLPLSPSPSNNCYHHQYLSNNSLSYPEIDLVACKVSGARLDLDADIDHLRWEICDFFENFKQVELIVTDILSAIVVFWFLGTLGVGFPVVELYASGGSLLGIPLLLLGGIILTTYSVPLFLFNGCIFQLQDNCLRSYTDLCSLMAIAKPNQRRDLLKMLELFNNQKRHQFRFLGAQRLSPTFLLTCISWTGTCLAMLLSSSKLELSFRYKAAAKGV